jgi:aminoglycoside phosphotransferase (APT) family kinase protein
MSKGMPEPPESTRPVRENHRFDEAALCRYLEGHVEGFAGPLQVRQFRGGQSNPTFWLGSPSGEWVLRKKPPGNLLPSAHAVDREHRVMAALAKTDVPVARMHALCEDPAVIGTTFFVMDHVPGRIFWDVQLPDLEPDERGAIYEELVRVLAAIHGVDLSAVGLEDYGKHGAYVARQVRRWSEQYRKSETGRIEAMERLIAWLPEHVPEDDETTLVHGDFRLDNLIFHPTEPRVLAVLDWELSTLGHPLADLAYACMLYDVVMPGVGGLLGADLAALEIPEQGALVARYQALTGRATTADFPYFKAFSFFRVAAIVQGVYKRALEGNASSADAMMYGAVVGHLAEVGCGQVGIG